MYYNVEGTKVKVVIGCIAVCMVRGRYTSNYISSIQDRRAILSHLLENSVQLRRQRDHSE